MNTKPDGLGLAKVILLIFLLCGFAWPAPAAVRTWDDESGNHDWFTDANWNPDGTPANSDVLSILTGVPHATFYVYTLGGGSIAVDGAGAVVTIDYYIYIGYSGTGTLNITGGTVSDSMGYIGCLSGSTGTATVDGSSSKWTNNSNVNIGDHGAGTLNIKGGGLVEDINSIISVEASSHGTVTVEGDRSTWNNSGYLIVGMNNDGTLHIKSGGTVTNTYCDIGALIGSQGTVTVEDAGSTWNNSSLYVGGTDTASRGTGTLTVQNGGAVNVTGTLKIWSTGTVKLLGSQINTHSFIVAPGATFTHTNGTLTVDGGTFDPGTANYMVNGDLPTVKLTNKATAHLTGWLSVGDDLNHTGALEILGGSNITNDNVGVIGSLTGSVGTVTVDGNGSLWENLSYLRVGSAGKGTLDIKGGGIVKDTIGAINNASPSECTVTVEGNGSWWNNSQYFVVGEGGTGTLDIKGGGTVTNTYGIIGSLTTASHGKVTVEDAGSTWTNSLYLRVGDHGAGTLNITGGTVSNTVGYIGYNSGSTGTVTVDGTGSTWNNSSLYVGGTDTTGGGTGVLTVKTGGTVNVGSLLKLWSTGTLNLNGGMVQAASFDLVAGTFNFIAGTICDTNDLTIGPDYHILNGSQTLGFAHHLQVDGTTTLGGLLTIDGGTFSTGALLYPNFLQFSCGTFNLTNSNLIIGNTGLFGPTITLTSPKTMGVTKNTTIEAAGKLDMQGGAFSAGTLTNQGTIQGTGQINAPLTNSSTGKVRSFAGEHLTFGGGGHLNQGQIQLYGGALEFSGDLTNDVGGLVMGNGNLIADGGTTNNSTMAFSATANVNGDVTNTTTGKIISAGGTTTFFDDVLNNGEIHTAQNSFTVFFGDVTGSGSFTGPGTFLLEGDLIAGSAALPEGLMLLHGPASSAASITGGGELSVGDDLMPCELTVSQIALGTLTIGAGSTVTIQAIPGGPLGNTITPVPEPSIFVLLGIGVISLLALTWRLRRWGV